jgi:NADPH-dependent 2,4-dienoyl-CoA reductase/sulfur reductase-like enzyme
MTSVCVIGGGTAGAEAAREASRGGARVTVLDKSEEQDPPWRFWPELIRKCSGAGDPPSAFGSASEISGVTRIFAEARSVQGSLVQAKGGEQMRFDSIIAATGCGFEPTSFPGSRKPGVHILDGASRYIQLGRLRSSMSEIVVQGEGALALQVAGQLCGDGRRVRILANRWNHGEPSPAVREVLEDAAGEREISTMKGILGKAVGSGSLEAIVVEGSVIPCDTLAVLPKRTPRVLPMEARIGTKGGILVDRTLVTSSPSIFAAGGCAELSSDPFTSKTLEDRTAQSGRIAGANSLGNHYVVDPVVPTVVAIFGLRWTRVCTGATAASVPGRLASSVSQRVGSKSACTIVFERVNGRVLAIETVEETTNPSVDISPGSTGAESLRTLAYSSSDISLVSDTARLGLNIWLNS